MKIPRELAAIIERDRKITVALLVVFLIAVAFFITYSYTGGYYQPKSIPYETELSN